ncbi:Uncharacterized protein SCF082_LOCUS31171 [Durusdinium trenchii]|uniref:Uncharacterized protein n=1 Tax=Durusdinium trenchii TaxID=1381693 RepID=A0ABP0N401_9DINO
MERCGEVCPAPSAVTGGAPPPPPVSAEAAEAAAPAFPVAAPGDQGQDDAGDEATPLCVDPEFSQREIKNGAGLVGAGMGGVVGSVFGMSIIGGAAGFIAGTKLADKDTENGARAREFGRAGAQFIRNLRSLDRKYKVTNGVKSTATKVATQTKEFSDKHDLPGKAQQAATTAARTASELAQSFTSQGGQRQAVKAQVQGEQPQG